MPVALSSLLLSHMDVLYFALLWVAGTAAQGQHGEIEHPPDVSNTTTSNKQDSKHSAAVVVAAILGMTFAHSLLSK